MVPALGTPPFVICDSINMKADRIEVSRDEKANNWLLRIQVGEEVIRRHCNESKDADEDTLRAAAAKTGADEGYTIDPLNIVFA
jgi:hypothetical protein